MADRAKRALVALIRGFCTQYGCAIEVTRESSDADVKKAYRAVSRKSHPDHGGQADDQKALNAAHDTWQEALRGKGGRGRPSTKGVPAASPSESSSIAIPPPALPDQAVRTFRIRSGAVLLTYHGFEDMPQWARFTTFVARNLRAWKVQYWTATMETTMAGLFHVHLMLQFISPQDRTSQAMFFEGLKPDARPNDLLGESFATKRWQQSVNRAHFYVWADKKGTAREASGNVCVTGNYAPAWTDLACTYRVCGEWPLKLWQSYKLSDHTYEEYMYLCRDGVPARKRNFEEHRKWQDTRALKQQVEERTGRLRSSPALYQAFGRVVEAEEWLGLFKVEALRYPLLLVHAPSHTGKTEWACSLFHRPLKVLVGTSTFFPDALRSLDRNVHDGLVLDDVRDLAFLSLHQEKLQGNYNFVVEFASTPGGQCAYSKDLWGLPIVATVNNTTRNLELLNTDDFLSRRANLWLLSFSGVPGQVPPRTAL